MTRSPTTSKRNTLKRTALALAVAAFALGFLGSGCEKRAPAQAAGANPQAAPKPVRLVAVESRAVDRFIEVTGTLYGEEEVTVAAEVGGRVVEVVADLGDSAAHGAMLARIDPTDYELAVQEQQSALQTALAKIGLDQLPEGEIDVESLPLVARAKAQESNARSRLDRARRLYERTPPLISEQDFADIQTQHEVATTSVNVERLSARSLVAEARVRASSLLQAQTRLADTRVIAPAEKPLTYRVAARRVSVGEVVASGQPMFRLVASDRVKFRGLVPERFARETAVGASAQLVIDGYPAPFEAKVARVSPAVDIQTRSFEVEVEAPNSDGRLKPGSFVLARIQTGTRLNSKFVPDSAVLQFAGVQRVFSIKDGKVAEHRVKLGKVENGMRQLLDELPGIDAVIDQPRGLNSGAPVVEAPAAK